MIYARIEHKLDKNINTIYTMPIGIEIVETQVHDILTGEKDIRYEKVEASVKASSGSAMETDTR